MKIFNIKFAFAALLLVGLVSCDNDDDNLIPGVIVPEPSTLNFAGTYAQVDQMGRPGINTVLSGTSEIKNSLNVTIPSQQGAAFQADFEAQLEGLHDAFGDIDYETNILGLDATQLTGFLASDVLQVAPGETTTYFDGTNVLTGRNLTDDVIDVSLILLFGGNDGARFNGENGTPILVTDNVSASGETPSATFPYLEAPHN